MAILVWKLSCCPAAYRHTLPPNTDEGSWGRGVMRTVVCLLVKYDSRQVLFQYKSKPSMST